MTALVVDDTAREVLLAGGPVAVDAFIREVLQFSLPSTLLINDVFSREILANSNNAGQVTFLFIDAFTREVLQWSLPASIHPDDVLRELVRTTAFTTTYLVVDDFTREVLYRTCNHLVNVTNPSPGPGGPTPPICGVIPKPANSAPASGGPAPGSCGIIPKPS